QRLVEQRALDAGALGAQRGEELRVLELGVQRIAGDVRDRCRDAVLERLEAEAAEGALIDEAQLGTVVGERHPYAQVDLVRGADRLDEQLAAHAEVAEYRLILSERNPQVLAAPLRDAEGATDESGGEVVRAGDVSPDRPGVQRLDGRDRA